MFRPRPVRIAPEAAARTAPESRHWRPAADRPLKLAAYMPAVEPVWDPIVAEQGVKTLPYAKAVGWGFGDFVFGAEFDVVSDMTKIRLAGFGETVDTVEALVGAILRQQADGTIPI
jgi:hypothetical protein